MSEEQHGKLTKFSIWIIVKDHIIENDITGLLINSKMSVQALAEDGRVCFSGEKPDLASYILAYKVSSFETHAPSLATQIRDLLSKSNIRHMGLIVSEFISNATWVNTSSKADSNISFNIVSAYKKEPPPKE